MFKSGDLEHQAKDAFFNGLHPEYQPMVIHKRDNPTVNITQLLAAIREYEENQEKNRHNHHVEYAKAYPLSTARNNNNNYHDHHQNVHACPSHTLPQNQGQNQNQNHYCQDDRNLPASIQSVHAEPDVHIQVNDDYLPPYIDYDNPNHFNQGDLELTLYTQSYQVAITLADNTERRHGYYYKCKETGHF